MAESKERYLEEEAMQKSILRQYEILRPEGIVCHTFWHGPDSDIYNDLYVNNHRDNDVRMLFGDYFDQLLIQFYKEFETGDSIIYLGKKRAGLPT
ncbi:MAG: hypothetical protein E4H10_12295 [Bacteroidia bacterium]|nr:MAG: hypothetical protein E4H10_12295 [Bacteroidia bacterium]